MELKPQGLLWLQHDANVQYMAQLPFSLGGGPLHLPDMPPQVHPPPQVPPSPLQTLGGSQLKLHPTVTPTLGGGGQLQPHPPRQQVHPLALPTKGGRC